uniref:DNA-directed RNA polymerase n=1 Tax=viral metagenome TaxID=1070528 RepID=A0A6C0AZI9_9ZZZZ
MSQEHDKVEELYSDSGSDEDVNSDSESVLSKEDEEEKVDYEEPEEEQEQEEQEEEEEDGKLEEGGENKFIPNITDADENNESEDDEDNQYLQKFNAEINRNYIVDFHPECSMHNYDEISVLSRIVRDKTNNIVDELHKTIPFLTKYERTRILGQRAKQLNSGAKAFIKVPENVIDGYLIAELELAEKRIPFIIRRPIPGGGCEYWSLKDLEIVSF